jgi:hypothetical protein
MTQQEHDAAAEAEREENETAGTSWKRTDIGHYCGSCLWETFGSIHHCRPSKEEEQS